MDQRLHHWQNSLWPSSSPSPKIFYRRFTNRRTSDSLTNLPPQMHSIMTGLIGALPFVAKRVKGNPIPTYGWRIFDLENRHMDIQLRHLVTQCMHERPADRPSVVNLLRHLMQAKQAGLMASKDHSRTFWSKVLGPPPLPTKRKSHARKVDKLASEGVILDDDAIKTAGRRGERSAVRTKRQPPRAARQGNRPQPSSSSSLASQEQNISPEVARRADSEPRDLADDLGIRIHISTKNLRRRRKQVSRSVRSETSRASLPGTPQLEALEELLPSIERAQEPEAGTEQQPVSGSEKIVLGPELDDSAPWLLQRDPLTPPPGMQW